MADTIYADKPGVVFSLAAQFFLQLLFPASDICSIFCPFCVSPMYRLPPPTPLFGVSLRSFNLSSYPPVDLGTDPSTYWLATYRELLLNRVGWVEAVVRIANMHRPNTGFFFSLVTAEPTEYISIRAKYQVLTITQHLGKYES